MDDEIKMMLNAILEEMSRTEERIYARMDSRFDKIEVRLESMQHEINACKLEKDTISILIKKIECQRTRFIHMLQFP